MPAGNSLSTVPANLAAFQVAKVEKGISPQNYPISLYTLKNGHRILIEQRPTDIVGIRTFIDTGSIIENAIKPSPLYKNMGFPSGIVHLDEHLRFPVWWASAVSKDGSRTNATTSDEQVQHELFFHREYLDRSLRLHAQALLRPVYQPEEINREKAAVLNEVALRYKSPDLKLVSRLRELLFQRPATQTGGKRPDVLTTTAEQLKLLHQSAYIPTNMVTVVSGNVDPQSVLSILGPEFGNNPNQVGLPVNTGLQFALKAGEKPLQFMTSPEWTTSKLLIGFAAPPMANLRERVAMEILQEFLSGDRLSILHRRLVNEQGLASSVGFAYEPMKQTGTAVFELDCQPGQEQSCLNAALGLIAEVVKQGMPPDALATIQNRLGNAFEHQFTTVEKSTLNLGHEALNNSLEYALRYKALVNSIQPEELRQVAQKYLDLQRYAVVMGLPSNTAAEGETP